jgi:hypothetical protein
VEIVVWGMIKIIVWGMIEDDGLFEVGGEGLQVADTK